MILNIEGRSSKFILWDKTKPNLTNNVLQDGSAVELIGLSYSSIKWLSEMNSKGFFKYESVTRVNDDCSTLGMIFIIYKKTK